MFGRERGKRATIRLQALSHCRFTSRLTLCVCEHMKWLRVRGRQLRLQSGTNPPRGFNTKGRNGELLRRSLTACVLTVDRQYFWKPHSPRSFSRHDKERISTKWRKHSRAEIQLKASPILPLLSQQIGLSFLNTKASHDALFSSSTTHFQNEHLTTYWESREIITQ